MFAYFALHPALAGWRRRRRRAAGVPDEVLDLLAVNVREIGVGHVEDLPDHGVELACGRRSVGFMLP